MIEIILLVIAFIWIVRLELALGALNKRLNDVIVIADNELNEIKEDVERIESANTESVSDDDEITS